MRNRPCSLAYASTSLTLRCIPPRQPEVVQRHLVDRADGNRGAVLRRHVPQRRAVGDGQELEARSVELHELPYDTELAEPLGNRQHEVGRGRTLGKTIDEPEPDDLGDQHRDWLAQHRGLGLDPADAPSNHAEAVDHRRVRIGADERVRIRQHPAVDLLAENDAREVLEIDLVDDAGVGRDDAEVVEGLLAPAEERVALAVTPELEGGVQIGGVALDVVIDLHRVIDDELHRLQRVDLSRVTAQLHDPVPHRGEIDDRRHAGEVLQQHPRGRERNLLLHPRTDVPSGERLDVLRVDESRVLTAEQVLEEDLQRIRQAGDVRKAGLLEGGEAEDVEGVATRP